MLLTRSNSCKLEQLYLEGFALFVTVTDASVMQGDPMELGRTVELHCES